PGPAGADRTVPRTAQPPARRTRVGRAGTGAVQLRQPGRPPALRHRTARRVRLRSAAMNRRTALAVAAGAVVAVGLLSVPALAHPRPVPPVGPPGAPPAADHPPQPVGQNGGWTMAFSDEFSGTALDTSKWSDASSAEADDGHGNKDNDQLEWN